MKIDVLLADDHLILLETTKKSLELFRGVVAPLYKSTESHGGVGGGTVL